MKTDPLFSAALPVPCFDAGSEFCPCSLADLGACVSCSVLRGENSCTCGWNGLCVYHHYLANGKKARSEKRERSGQVLSRNDLKEAKGTAFTVKVQVDPFLAQALVFPGSFLLLRPEGSPVMFNVPLSVMTLKDDGAIMAVQVTGPKTKALSEACKEGESVTYTGPFWSGIQEVRHLKRFASRRTLAVAKGIGQAAVIQAARYVNMAGGTFKALLGPGTLGVIFADKLLEEAGATVLKLPRQNDHNLTHIYAEVTQGGYQAVLSAGSERQHRGIYDLLQSLKDPPAFVWTSNMTMTCAQGICGSCLAGGFRTCKAQVTPEEGLGR